MKFGGVWSSEQQDPEGDIEEGLKNLVVCDDDDSQEPDELLSIGDRLYCKVYNLQPEYAEKITGMLLECDADKQLSMLNNDALLEEMVARAVEVLTDNDEIDISSSDVSFAESDDEDDEIKEQLGETLFERVEEFEPELCGQITGMLLELDEPVIRELLESKDSLEKAVAKARAEYLMHSIVLPPASDDSSSSDEDELACDLFDLVSEKCPDDADRITGMLLELDECVIQKLLDNPKDLDASIQRAKTALSEDGMV